LLKNERFNMPPGSSREEFRAWWASKRDAGHRYKTEEWFQRNAYELSCLFPHGGTLVDVGCGNAQLLAYLAPHYGEVIGVDCTPSMLEAAKIRLNSFGVKNVRLELGDACELPRSITQANVIVSNQVVQNLDPEEVQLHLRECRRVLAVGGAVGMCGIPWINLRDVFLQGLLAEPMPGRMRRLARRADPRRWPAAWRRMWRGGVMADGIGRWYGRKQIADLAATEGFSCETVKAWYYEYRFHAKLRLIEESK
jgi:SAM-dependent methyltransferase